MTEKLDPNEVYTDATSTACMHPACILRHPHDGPTILRGAEPMVPIELLSDRAIAEETLMWMRTAGQAIAELQKVGVGGMLKGMLGKGK